MLARAVLRPKPAVTARSGVKATATNPLSGYVDAAIGALALRVDPRWTPMIAVHLQVILQQAALVSAFTLPDDAEPAPIFKA
jgi:hypothetical protein